MKASIAATLHPSKDVQFIAHVTTFPGNAYDGHTLARVIPALEKQVDGSLKRIVADRGYRGDNALQTQKFKVYISGQKLRVTDAIKRELRRRSAVEPVIGHLKTGHRMGRNFLAHSTGDAINVILAAAGLYFRRLLVWLRFIFALLLLAINRTRAKEIQFSIA